MQNSEGVSLIHLLARQVSLYSETGGSHGADAILVEFPKKATGGSLETLRSSKTFPDMSNEFRVSGSRQESRLINPRGLGKPIG